METQENERNVMMSVLAGIGTSWHAALVGELLLARAGGLGHRVRGPEPKRASR